MDNITININEAQPINIGITDQEPINIGINGSVIYTTAVFEWVTPPATRNSDGIVGQQSFDDDYLYICVAPNQWARTLLMKGW